jgi:predicted homoserine dehydrogenase-like protein
VLCDDAVLQPIDGPRVDVVATAKTDLKAGTVIDALGGYHTYGEAEAYDVSRAEQLLPMGLAEGCKLLRDVRKDQALTYADVEVPEGRLVDRLRAEQDEAFPSTEQGVRAAA